MWVTESRRRQIGWIVVLLACAVLLMGLTFKVNTIKSQIRLAERQIIALETEKRILEIEFQARSNQQQLADWNRVEYGYVAPSAGQYLESERQLAALGMARADDAPDPVRFAQAAPQEPEGILAMVSPLTGEPAAPARQAEPVSPRREPKSAAQPLAERLSRPQPLGDVMAEVAE
ncbi:MAG: hypothetical protein ACK4GD_07965 [Sphingomonadaceae bacterium]